MTRRGALAVISFVVLASCAPASGKGSDYVVYHARRGEHFWQVQVTLPIEKVCATTSTRQVTRMRLASDSGGELMTFFFDHSSKDCQKHELALLEELFDNGTKYTAELARKRGPTWRLPLLESDPLFPDDV